jgi:hypothetical protein
MKNLIEVNAVSNETLTSWRTTKPFRRTSALRKKAAKDHATDRFRNLNHHLWNNNGTWFIHYTIYPTLFTKERHRASLGTHDLETARAARDVILEGLEHYTRKIK